MDAEDKDLVGAAAPFLEALLAIFDALDPAAGPAPAGADELRARLEAAGNKPGTQRGQREPGSSLLSMLGGLFKTGGAREAEARQAILGALRRGPHTDKELLHSVRDELDQPGLRSGQLYPAVVRLAERGLVSMSRGDEHRIYALTAKGHEAAGLGGDGEPDAKGDADGGDVEEEVDGATARQIAAMVGDLYDRWGLPAPDEVARSVAALPSAGPEA